MFHVKPLTINKLIFAFVFADFIKMFLPYLFSCLEVFGHPCLFFDFYSLLNFSQKEIINTSIEIILKISPFVLSWYFVVVFNKLIFINQYNFY